jgi:O-acetyl-ADP-ribose deacetylase (regulator of RNase III)
MAELKHIIGNALEPVGTGNKVVVHCCNDIGAWGSGFVVAVSQKWPQPAAAYRLWSKNKETFKLGEVQMVPVTNEITIANLIGQENTGWSKSGPPIRYDAIRKGLKAVKAYCEEHYCSVHCPMFGAGLAGGDWNTIENIINEELITQGINVTVYEYIPVDPDNDPTYIPIGTRRTH